MLDSMYMTMSISSGLYPNLDLWNANKLQLQLQHNLGHGLDTHALHHGFSDRGMRTTTGTPTIVYWYAAFIKKIEI